MSKKKEWIPPPPPPREKFGECSDCGGLVWKMQSIWQMVDSWVCFGCRHEYREAGIGFLDCAGLVLPGTTLEG